MSDTNPLPRAREALERIQLCWASETEQPREEDYDLIATALDAAERDRRGLRNWHRFAGLIDEFAVVLLGDGTGRAVVVKCEPVESSKLSTKLYARLRSDHARARTPDGGPDDADG